MLTFTSCCPTSFFLPHLDHHATSAFLPPPPIYLRKAFPVRANRCQRSQLASIGLTGQLVNLCTVAALPLFFFCTSTFEPVMSSPGPTQLLPRPPDVHLRTMTASSSRRSTGPTQAVGLQVDQGWRRWRRRWWHRRLRRCRTLAHLWDSSLGSPIPYRDFIIKVENN